MSSLSALPKHRELMTRLGPLHARLSSDKTTAKKHPVYRCNKWQPEIEDFDRAAASLAEEGKRKHKSNDASHLKEDELLARALQESLKIGPVNSWNRNVNRNGNAYQPIPVPYSTGLDLEIEFDDHHYCKGLVIEGIEFQPLEKVEDDHQVLEYKEILKSAEPPLMYRSIKELNMLLSKGVLLNEGKTWFYLNDNGENCEMISIAECMISYEDETMCYTFGYNSRKCAGCNLVIDRGQVLSRMGAVWHPECFRCHKCNLPIADNEFSLSGKDVYHKSCYKENHHPRGDVCQNFIRINAAGFIEYKVHPFWDQKYCIFHDRDGTPRCCSCERIEVGDEVFLKSILNSTETLARGRVKSLDPNEQIRGKEIGREWCGVNVQVAIKRDEYLMRPYGFLSQLKMLLVHLSHDLVFSSQ